MQFPGRRLSISIRLTLWYGMTILLLLSLFAVSAYSFFHNSLHQDFDRHLNHERNMVMPYVRLEGGKPAVAALGELRGAAYQTDGVYGTFVRLLAPDGAVLYQTPNFAGHTLLPVRLPEASGVVSVSREWEERPMRSHYMPLVSDSGALAGWLEVSGFEWTLHHELDLLGRALLIGILLSTLLAGGGGYLLARRALQPVALLTEAAKRIGTTDLGARLPTQFGVQDELSDLAETFNNLIERLEASFRRERRFTSNAAHELLTPLTTMRNGAEIVLRRERTPEVYQQKYRAMLEDVDKMIATVRGLLQLARVERLKDMPHEPVELGQVCDEHLRRFQERAAAQRITLTHRTEPGLYVLADAVRLGEVVDNLVDNALKYTPEGGRISVQVERDGETAALVVEDTGVGFGPEQASQLFDRFYRADVPEVQARSGSGLGLSIVQAIVQLYGGRIKAHSEGVYRGSRFEVRLPLAQPAEDVRVSEAAPPLAASLPA
jgi:signal transduction histidine kinase